MKKICFIFVLLIFLATGIGFGQEKVVWLDELEPVNAAQAFGSLQTNQSYMGKPLSIAGELFDNGLWTHAYSQVLYELDGQYLRFEAKVGVDDAVAAYTTGTVVFKVFADGELVFDSGIMKINEAARSFSVSVEGVQTLELIVTDAADGIDCDHATWGNARLITTPNLIKSSVETSETESKAFTVSSEKISLDLSETGKIVGMKSGAKVRPLGGRTELKGCRNDSEVRVNPLPNNGKEFVRIVRDENGNGATVSERFTPSADGICWELEIVGLGDPWSTSILRLFDYKATQEEDVLFWTTWSDPRCGRASAIKKEDIVQRDPATVLYPLGTEHNWTDPLLPQPLVRTKLFYGLTPFNYAGRGEDCPFAGNLFCIPLLSWLEPQSDFGLTFGCDPSDTFFDLFLDLTEGGKATWNYSRLRISKDSPIRLRAEIVPHQADWRCALGWMKTNHPDYILPPNPKAHEIAGTAAYERSPGIPETCSNPEKYREMGFRVNWQASWDFPFFGMYIPPTADDGETWKAFGGWDYSVAQYEIDAKRMKDAGFYSLNYFNVFEIGSHTKWPEPPRQTKNKADLWKNNDDFIYTKLKDGLLLVPQDQASTKGKQGDFAAYPVGSWEGSLIFDCAVPCVKDFLLDQARLHLEKIPSTDGFCIDRLDWIRWYSLTGDDGVSWFHDRKSRCLLSSWHQIMEELGPLMHDAGKVIYVNNHNKRIDALRHIDGIYDEFTYAGAPLNLTALLCVAKPALGWTSGPHDLLPDPDAFFQKNLYLGVFPTAPLPNNCHCINPDPYSEQFYRDYGKLLDMMRGKQWVLAPHCVVAKEGAAKVNLFETPEGFVLPVCFAGNRSTVEVVVRNVDGIDALKAVALQPGESKPIDVPTQFADGQLTLIVPVKRGCAMVKLTK